MRAFSSSELMRFAPVDKTEKGLMGLSLANWFALFAPAGTPRDVIERLSRDVNAVLALREVREQLDKLAFEPKGWASSPSRRLRRLNRR